MAGVTVRKQYIGVQTANTANTNNWSVLVLGITSQGPTEPTVITDYNTFLNTFGTAIAGIPTHAYVRFLLNSGVAVIFKRVIDNSDTNFTYSELVFDNEGKVTDHSPESTSLFNITATENYRGAIGNNISIALNVGSGTSNVLQVYYNNTGDSKPVETINIPFVDVNGNVATSAYEALYAFVNNNNDSLDSEYINIELIDSNIDNWNQLSTVITVNETNLENGKTPENTLSSAINILTSDITTDPYSFWLSDKRLRSAITYYPTLRFITTGGIVSSETDLETQDTINLNLGKFAYNYCNNSFRVLIDYPKATADVVSYIRNTFVPKLSTANIPASVFAYFGYWGADSSNNWLPGSAGFLSALGNSGYNVYSRRIAGPGFTPSFVRSYKEVFIDELNDWQDEDSIQLNPIVEMSPQGNLAVMGSSTLQQGNSNYKDPAQALDVLLVGDYIAALLNALALGELENAVSRLMLNSLSSRMDTVLNQFVTSNAITRYELYFNIATLGRLDITCVLYFAIGLEEVSLTLSSTYDTEIAM